MNKPRFNGTPVASLDSLSAMLGIERKRLDWIVKSVSMSYKQFKVETGKNKKERQIFEPKRSLKGIQKKINKEIFGNDSNLLIVFYVQIMPDDFVMQLHRF